MFTLFCLLESKTEILINKKCIAAKHTNMLQKMFTRPEIAGKTA